MIRNISITISMASLIVLCNLGFAQQKQNTQTILYFPADKARDVNPDTHLVLTFPSDPNLGNSGKIRIYDAADDRLVDTLDLSIPAGPVTEHATPKPPYMQTPYPYLPGEFTNANTRPGTPSGGALPAPDTYQLTIIGGFTDGFHFYPVIIRDNTATLYPHNNLLGYNKTYYVQIDAGVLSLGDGSFVGITGKTGWVFTTKKLPPAADSQRLVVSTDGSGDFNTVQGAVDFIADNNPRPVTVFVKNGIYEEIVYFRNKTNITILGQDRDKVVVQYANREIFNPHPSNISTNEVEGSFPSRRAAFAVDHCSRIHLVNMTIMTTCKNAQAEGLLMNGSENIVYNVTIVGSGDALQSNGSAYYSDCRIEGQGDTVLGRGPAFFQDCRLISDATFMWIRNTAANHGNVFANCQFEAPEGKETDLARAPDNGGKGYPYCEAVLLDCKLAGILPVGWGTVGKDSSNVHYWEYNSTNLGDGMPVDVSKRHSASRQLTKTKDAEIISNYSNPAYVLGGWTPSMAPLIMSQPKSIEAKQGQSVSFDVKVAAIPHASYQWLKNGQVINGATNTTLSLSTVSARDAGSYRVVIKNSLASVTSDEASFTVK